MAGDGDPIVMALALGERDDNKYSVEHTATAADRHDDDNAEDTHQRADDLAGPDERQGNPDGRAASL